MSERKAIEAFELVDHGIDHESYFQGCGVSCTEYTDIATGIGDNPAEAIDDCLEQLAMMDWNVDGMESRILEECCPGKRKLPSKPRVLHKHGDEAHYYVSIRVRGSSLHQVVVENVGTVYCGSDETAAKEKYRGYAGRYKPFGCNWFAAVTWIEGDDIRAEYYDPNGPSE